MKIAKIVQNPTTEQLTELVLESDQEFAYGYYQGTKDRVARLAQIAKRAYLCDNGALYYFTVSTDGVQLINRVSLGTSTLCNTPFMEVSPIDLTKGSFASMLKTQNEIVADIVGRIEDSTIPPYEERALGMKIVNTGNSDGYVVVSSNGSEGNFTTLKEARKWLVMLYLISEPAFRTHIARKALYNMGGHLSYDLLLRMSRGYLFPEWLTRSKCGNGKIVVDGDVIL